MLHTIEPFARSIPLPLCVLDLDVARVINESSISSAHLIPEGVVAHAVRGACDSAEEGVLEEAAVQVRARLVAVGARE